MVVETERRRTALRAPAPVDPEKAKKLAALGYLTGTPRDEAGARPDPKDAIGSLVRLQQAAGLHTAGRSAEAVPILLEVLAANPRLVDAWEVLASALERLGRTDEALAALKKTVALSPPGRTNYLVAVANLALRAGRPERPAGTRSWRATCGDPRAYAVLGRLALREGKLSEALRVIDEGLKRFGCAPSGRTPRPGRRSSGGRRSSPRRKRSTAWSEAHPRSLERSPASRSSRPPGATSPKPRGASTRWCGPSRPRRRT